MVRLVAVMARPVIKAKCVGQVGQTDEYLCVMIKLGLTASNLLVSIKMLLAV